MFQVPAHIWQQIGQIGLLPTTRWAKAMLAGQPGIDRLMANVDAEHAEAQVPNGVPLAFEVTAPLIVENERIQNWIRDNSAFGMS